MDMHRNSWRDLLGNSLSEQVQDARLFCIWEELQMSKQDEEVIRKIYIIVQRGNNVEIKKDREGNLKVFEVKKNIVAM